jgi:hypothetical protein
MCLRREYAISASIYVTGNPKKASTISKFQGEAT